MSGLKNPTDCMTFVKRMLKQSKRVSRIAVAFLLLFWLTPTLANAGSSIETKTDFGKFQTTVTSKSTGASAICNDGTFSYSQSRQGTCSWHNGVRQWCPCGVNSGSMNWSNNSLKAWPSEWETGTVICKTEIQAAMKKSTSIYFGLLQSQLRKMGAYTGPIDGRWGSQSRRALEKFSDFFSLTEYGLSDLQQTYVGVNILGLFAGCVNYYRG